MSSALVILCGGLSTRMGSDKAFLPFGKTSLLNYQVSRFQPYFKKIFVSVPSKKERPIDYTSVCGCEEIEDLGSRLGPLGGIYSCLKKVSEDVLFFISVDAPFTDPALAEEITKETEKNAGLYACTIQDPKGRIQPTFSAYKKECLPIIETLIAEKKLKVRFLFDALGKNQHYKIYEHFHPTGQFFNMNDPQAYYYGLKQHARRHPGEFPPDFAPAAGVLSVSAEGSRKNNMEEPILSSAVNHDNSKNTISRKNTSGTSVDSVSIVRNTDGRILPVLSFTAKSGTGKTTYLEKLLPLLKEKGLRIAVVKHDAHGFEIDKPGKDSYRLSHAGADHMILTSEDQTAVIIRHPGMNPDFDSLLCRIQNADLILTEGYKLGNQKKIHLLRKGYNETPVGNTDNIIAYITDFPFETEVPVFNLNRPEDLVDFVLSYVRKAQRNQDLLPERT